VRADDPADDDRAPRPAFLDLLDAKTNHAVVDQDVVAGGEHVADHGRRDRQVAVAGRLLRGDDHLLAAREQTRPLEDSDSELRPLQVRDQGEGPAGVVGRRADQGGPRSVLVVRRVREVEASGVHARIDERREPVAIAARRPDRHKDLRPPRSRRHEPRVAMRVTRRLAFAR
jgi:hypothetical protein